MTDGQPNLPAREVAELQTELRLLQQRLTAISQRLDQLATPPPPVLPSSPPPVIEVPPVLPAAPPPVPPVAKESFEVRLGTFWLPRVGMALLLIGMVFLVTWTYRYLGAGGKVALSYGACAALAGLGWWLEKRMEQLARVLQAGALALTYFVTYATHYVEAFQVIQSPAVALGLLSVVVAGIVVVADRRASATLAGLALFFGYLTTVISGVASFTLAANAVLALAALFFLARNRWVTISYGAVFATYLTYTIWVWKLNQFGDLERLVFGSAYLDEPDFRLRAGFLSLYWLLFTVGGLLVRREALGTGERNGLLTLNNAFFFALFSLLVHHAHPGEQWAFQFCFGGALLVASAIAYQRYQPERAVMDALFVQGVAVATLGLISKLQGVHLVASLAVESLFLLWLAQAMSLRWIAWLGRAVFGVAAVYAWSRPDWESPMFWGAVLTAVVGLIGARMTKKDEAVSVSALYYAVVSVALAMCAVGRRFDLSTLPWVWPVLAVVVALAGVLLRTRELVWLANLPLAWAHLKMHSGDWELGPVLWLIAVTFGFGLSWWARQRDENTLWPYALAAVAAMVSATFDFVPREWRLAAFAGEGAVLVLSGVPVLVWLALAPLMVGTLGFIGVKPYRLGPPKTAWSNALLAWLLLVLSARVLRLRDAQRGLRVTIITVLTTVALFALGKLLDATLLTVGWALAGFVLLALGFAVRERPYRIAGLVMLGFGVVRVMVYDLAKVGTIYRILSFIGLGVVLLVLAFLYARNRERNQ